VDDVNRLGWPGSDTQPSELGHDERLQIDPAREAAHYKKMYDRVSALAKIGVWECVLVTEHLTWTDTVYDLFDIPRGAPIHRAEIVGLYHPESRREMERLRAEAIRSGTGFTLDIRIRTALGNERWVRLSADVEQEDGRSVRIFGTKQDISLERAAREKMQALQTELIHVPRVSAMGTMASTLAHELN
jgi:two-component system, LuxR family, sensor kinase FixL